MLKKIGALLLCTVLGSSLYARDISENQRFLGIEVSNTKVQGQQPSDNSDDGSYGFRVGAQNETWRSMFTINIFESEAHNVEKLFLSTDYFFLRSDRIESSAFQPYLGVNFGYMNFESTGVDEDGFLYGVQAGIIIEIMDTVDFDLGYRYSLSSSDELDHTGDLFFGINYHY